MRKLSAVTLCLMLIALTVFAPMSALADTATPTDAVIPVTQTPTDPVIGTQTDPVTQTQTSANPAAQTPTDSVQTQDVVIAATATSVKIWGKTLASVTDYYHNGPNGGQGTVDSNSTDYNAHYDPDTGILTLKGLSALNCNTKDIDGDVYAIYAQGALEIKIITDSAVSAIANEGNNRSCGVYVDGELTVSGSAALTATGGTMTPNTAPSFGVRVECGITVNSGSIEGFGGDANNDSYGVYAHGTVTVNGGSLEGTGGDAGNKSYGVHVSQGNITVSGGSIEGSSGTATQFDSCGVYMDRGSLINISAGSIEGTSDGAGRFSYGVFADNQDYVNISSDINISGGTIEGTGGTANKLGGKSFGVRANGNIVTSGGSITGNAATATNSYGVYSSGDITANAGTISGTGVAADIASCGVCAYYGNISVTGGDITGNGGIVDGETGNSYGVFVNTGNIEISDGSIAGTGGTVTGSNCGSHGVRANGNIVTSGGGITGTSGAATAHGCRNHGVYADGNTGITMTGGSITGRGNTADTYSFGVWSYYGVTVQNSGSIEGWGGDADSDSFGVYAYNDIKAENGGSITGTSGTATGNSRGVSTSQNLTTVNGGSIEGNGGVASGTNVNSYGVYSSGDITANAGTISGNAATATNSYGMYAKNGSITVNGGSITGAGGAAANSYGVWVHHGITASGTNCSIDGTGSTATGNSCGVTAEFGSITVSGTNCSIDGTGSTAYCSYGVMANSGSITVSGANCSIEGSGAAAACSFGVYADSITANAGSSIEGIGGGTTDSNNSIGIYSDGGFSVANGATTLAQGYTRAIGRNNPPNLNGGTASASTSYDGSGLGTYVAASWTNYRYFCTPGSFPEPQITVTQSSFARGKAPANETVTVGVAGDPNFNATNNFGRATMDGTPIDLGQVGTPGTDGSVENGSIVIHLNQTYLNSLSAGAHTLSVNLAGAYVGRYIDTTITVTGGGTPVPPYPSDNPATGDSANIALWTAVAIIAAGVTAIAVKKRKA